MKRFFPVLALVISLGADAQTYPSKPIRVVVPYTAGGPADLLVRGMGQKLGEAWGQQIIVENKPGANEMIAAQDVAKSAPDGYSYLLASDAVFALNAYLYSKLPYDPVKDFVPVSKLVNANLMLVARPDFPAGSVRELIDHARQNPGKLNYGSVGAGGVNHLAMAWFNTQNGLDMQHVPYKGLVQGLQDIMTSRLDVMFAVIGGAAPHLKAGKMKALAVSGKARNALIPEVPTFAEAGLPGFDASFYFGLAAPAGTPREVVQKFATESAKIVNAAEFREKYLNNLGFEPVGDSPEQFAAFLRQDREVAARKVKASGAKLD
ncbi:MAG: tripartite tricarboxylate transporter substrate binding protein [Pseudomonadota bacterium]|nr:tripartite tricarboxylate transporter substrate binding protein [Pseudomonadota bacterium]